MPPSVLPTGVTRYDPERAHGCYVLFDGRNADSFLIDMNGTEINRWPYSGFPVEMIDPDLADGVRGRILAQKEPGIFQNETLIELDWNGTIVWEWGEKAPGGKARQVHDLARLANGNTLVLAGADRIVPRLSDRPVGDGAIYELDPDGDIVWQWFCCDHLDELGFTDEMLPFVFGDRSRPRRRVIALNDMAPLGPNKWYAAGDDRFHPDNILIDDRDSNVIAIIARASGHVVWRIGPSHPSSYDFSRRESPRALPRPVDHTSGQHDVHMIPEGLPGAGNILIFDNQGPAGHPQVNLEFQGGSRILEIDPVSMEVVWQYDGASSGEQYWTFYSSFISSARRLPNGNTLICEGMHGRIFQVMPDGEIVWEYVNPHFAEAAGDAADDDGPNKWVFKGRRNWIYRAQPVPYSWAPEGTPHSEKEVVPPRLSEFRV